MIVSLCVAVEQPEEVLGERLYKHTFRARDGSMDITKKRFNSSSFKTAGDRLEQAQ